MMLLVSKEYVVVSLDRLVLVTITRFQLEFVE